MIHPCPNFPKAHCKYHIASCDGSHLSERGGRSRDSPTHRFEDILVLEFGTNSQTFQNLELSFNNNLSRRFSFLLAAMKQDLSSNVGLIKK